MSLRPKLTEDPKALEGAYEWSQKELERMEREERAAKMIYERIKPLREEAFRRIHERKKREATTAQ